MSLILVLPLSAQTYTRTSYIFRSDPDAWLAPVSAVSAVGALLLDAQTQPLTVDEIERLDVLSVPAFDRPATLFSSPTIRTASDISLIVAVVTPMLVLPEFNNDFLHLVGMYAETIALAGSLPSYAKAFGRIRPITYNTDAPMELRLSPDMRRSFFSGHAAVSMAAGVFLATVYENHRPGTAMAKAMWVGGVGIGLVTGALRVFSGMHFPSDVLVGAAVGAVVGYAVPKLHEQITEIRTISPASAPPPMFTLRFAI